jgi:hypothetical protein
MREIPESTELVACCGLYCGACKAYLKERCDGCRKNVKATWCHVRSCCLDKHLSSCAECTEHTDPRDCRKFHSVFSILIGFVLRSDRPACIDQIKRIGTAGHAKTMAAQGIHAIRK